VPATLLNTLQTVIDALTGICGSRFVRTDPGELSPYERDQTLDLHFPFDVLVLPATAEEVAAVVGVCHQHRVPVTPRGGGSGVTGGALPVHRGVVLSLERLNAIIGVHPVDGYVVAEAGVVTADLCAAAEDAGLYFPAAPSSSAYACIGGNVAENAGSIRSARYGTVGRYVLNLEVVLPDGQLIWTGANVTKNAAGLNLTQLFVGSEGLLGIITKVVCRLVPRPPREATLLAAFDHLRDACDAVVALKGAGLAPAAVELIGNQALRITAASLAEPTPLLHDRTRAHLLVDLTAGTEAALAETLESAALLLARHTAEPVLVGTSAAEKEKLWRLRFAIGTALTRNGRKYRDLDVCVPLSQLYDYLVHVEAVGAAYGIPVVSFGHALDGNLHTMLLLDGPAGTRAGEATGEIYAYATRHGGVLSGEHGIGLLQKEFMDLQFPPHHLALMRRIKAAFDPHGILNPGKVLS
jgi:glycolate oxidase